MSEPIENHFVKNELSYINRKEHQSKHSRAVRRDRESSLIPVRTLQCLRNTNRKVREFVYKSIRSSTSKSIKDGKDQNKAN